MTRPRAVGLFLLGSLLLCLVTFRGAMWGSTILAPIDIAPTLFAHYGFVNPEAGNIPANHYIIDQLTFDLPLQHTIYDALHHGEFPWWDPYTYGGRPLLADAHVNGTAPVRLLTYVLLPFVSAYNWNLILNSLLTGLGMCTLLLHLRFRAGVALPLALTYQFAGCFAEFFGHPWVQASFEYYPFLWIVWANGLQGRFSLHAALGATLCGLIFYSGNLQSHAYIALFAACFVLAYAFLSTRMLRRVVGLTALSGVGGGALAAPVLIPQLELFTHSVRGLGGGAVQHQYLGGILSLASFFPWALGSFRTLDLGKYIELNGVSFVLFIGSSLSILALLGIPRQWRSADNNDRRVATLLVIFYLIICSTALIHLFYLRMAPLAVIGLIVLAAYGLQYLEQHPEARPKLAWTVTGAATVLVVALNLIAFIVYPRIVARIRSIVAAHMASDPSFNFAPALRAFQISNLPHEISLLNVETLNAFVGLLVFALYLYRRRPQPIILALLLVLNLFPVLHYFDRFIPHQPREYWERLARGGPEQLQAASALNPQHLRLLDQAPMMLSMLFPNDLGHLRKVHTVHGYAALQPVSLFTWPSKDPPAVDLLADYMYRTSDAAPQKGTLDRLSTAPMARFHTTSRTVTVKRETLTTLKLRIGPGPKDRLLRTDTDYPGWQASWNGRSIPLTHEKVPFSSVQLPAADSEGTLTFDYRPTHLTASLWLAGSVFLFLLLVPALGHVLERRKNKSTSLASGSRSCGLTMNEATLWRFTAMFWPTRFRAAERHLVLSQSHSRTGLIGLARSGCPNSVER